jgi:hypothetical protein
MNIIVENKQTTAGTIAIKTWTEKRIVFIELHDGRLLGFPADRFELFKKANLSINSILLPLQIF